MRAARRLVQETNSRETVFMTKLAIEPGTLKRSAAPSVARRLLSRRLRRSHDGSCYRTASPGPLGQGSVELATPGGLARIRPLLASTTAFRSSRLVHRPSWPADRFVP